MKSNKMHAIVVLPDGETWNTVDSCSICIITDEDLQKLVNDEIDARDLIPPVEIGLGVYYHGSGG
jgi:hypothetical protein